MAISTKRGFVSRGWERAAAGERLFANKKGGRAIFIHGFAKNEKDNLSTKELVALKEFSKILVSLSEKQITTAIKNGDFKEVSK